MSRVNNVMVVLKMIAPLFICGAFLFALQTHGGFHFERLSSLSHPSWKAIFEAIATSGIIFSYNGFNQATVFAAEAKNPRKSIPFAILGSILLAGLMYVLIQCVFLLSVPEESLTQGWKRISFSGDEGPFAGLAVALGLHGMLGLIYADAILSPAGTALSYASAAPRLFFSLGQQNESFGKFTRLNRAGVPYLSVLMTLGLECLALVILPSLKSMISILVAAFVLCYTVAPASLLALRRSAPDVKRPFRLVLAPGMCFLSVMFSQLMVLSCGWVALRNLIFTSSVLILGYLLNQVRQNQDLKTLLSDGVYAIWFFLQMFLLAVLSYFAQENALSFQVECLWVLLLSGLSLYLSQVFCKKT